jgi:hypothetical protein
MGEVRVRAVSFSVGQRKIMNHFVVEIVFASNAASRVSDSQKV